MIVYHVSLTASDDYFTRRERHRYEHIERLLGLRERGHVIAGGPAPDGRTADLFYRVGQPGHLTAVVEEDPYWQGGVWTSYACRSFAGFVEPWQAVEPVLDGSRRVTVVEGAVTDAGMAEFALIEMRGRGEIVLGGFFADGASLALVRDTDEDRARAGFAETGFWAPASLSVRPLLHVV